MNQLSTKIEPVSRRHKCANWATVQNVVGVLSSLKTFCAGDEWHHWSLQCIDRVFQTKDRRRSFKYSGFWYGCFILAETTIKFNWPRASESEGQKDIFVSFLAWFLYHGYYWIEYVLTFWSKDVVRTLTLCDIFLVVLAFDKAFSDRNVTSREKLISGAGWERCEAEEGANWKKFVKVGLDTISWQSFFFLFFAIFLEMLHVIFLYL